MADTYTRRLGGAILGTAGTVVLGVVPTGETWVIRDLAISSLAGAAMTVYIYLVIQAVNHMLFVVQIQPNTTQHLDLRQSVKPGEQLAMQSTSGPCHGLVTGYVFPEAT